MMMSGKSLRFGEVLRKARNEKGHTLEKLQDLCGQKKGNISDVERLKKKPSENLMYAIVQQYPTHKKELMQAYLFEHIPQEVLENAKENKDFVIDSLDKLAINLSKESRLEIYKILLKLLEVEHVKNGTYDKAKSEIEIAKKKIEKIENKE